MLMFLAATPHASAGEIPPTTPPNDPTCPTGDIRPGDVLYIGHDGSSASAFTHAPLCAPGESNDIASLLAGLTWYGAVHVDVSSTGQVVVADYGPRAIYTTQLGTGGMRVLSGRKNGQDYGDGPGIYNMGDLEFGPDGFVYLLTTESQYLSNSRQVMRIDPQDGTRLIAAVIGPPIGLGGSRFAFAPSGELFVTLNFPADPNPLSSHNPMPPQPYSKIFRVDVETGVVEPFPSDDYRYEFHIDEIAIGDQGQALLLAESFLWGLDLSTGAISPHPGFFPNGKEVEFTPDGTPVVLSDEFQDGLISAFDADSQSWTTVATAIGFNNSPFTMALVPVPEPSSGAMLALLLAIASGACWRARRRG
jgi:hypothetical protein